MAFVIETKYSTLYRVKKKFLSVTIVGEFYTFVSDLDLEFQAQIFFFVFLLHCVLLIAKVKLFQETIGRRLIVLLKKWQNNDFFNQLTLRTLTATLWFWIRFHQHLIYHSLNLSFIVSLNDQMMILTVNIIRNKINTICRHPPLVQNHKVAVSTLA